ncbi:coenzyme A pyrophosphatase, partial [Leucobacter sp. OLES1]
MRHHAGQIAFPGGGVEPGDLDRAATALREAWE